MPTSILMGLLVSGSAWKLCTQKSLSLTMLDSERRTNTVTRTK